MITQKHITAEQIAGMDACIRGLRDALEHGERNHDLSFIRNEVDAITDHWLRLRGPMPEEVS